MAAALPSAASVMAVSSGLRRVRPKGGRWGGGAAVGAVLGDSCGRRGRERLNEQRRPNVPHGDCFPHGCRNSRAAARRRAGWFRCWRCCNHSAGNEEQRCNSSTEEGTQRRISAQRRRIIPFSFFFFVGAVRNDGGTS
jgi:hypothetical protein